MKTKLNEQADTSVQKYADSIIEAVKTFDLNIKVSVDKYNIENEAKDQHASKVELKTEYATVLIFPDFIRSSSVAVLFNKGKESVMKLMGLSQEEIDNAPLYGESMRFSQENIISFANFLSKDLGYEHQKTYTK